MSRRRHRRMAESSKRNQGVTSLVRRNQAKHLIVWFCRLLSVILGALLLHLWHLRATNTTSPSNNIKMNDTMLIYKLVETGTTRGGLAFQRYKAMESNDSKPISVQQWTRALASGKGEASDSFTRVLQNAPYKAFFLETKGVTFTFVEKEFEFVLVDAPHLASFAESQPDMHSFQQHFASCTDRDVCVFPNLGRDAMLIAPIQRHDDKLPPSTYSHLAKFVRTASAQQVRHLWQQTAIAYQQQYSNNNSSRPVWLSTEGSGVAWLHVRLDSRPKYYHYTPFALET